MLYGKNYFKLIYKISIYQKFVCNFVNDSKTDSIVELKKIFFLDSN